MYTQCPECQKQHTVGTDELRATRGMIKCENCAAMFDALEYISDQPIIENPDKLTDALFLEPRAKPRHKGWFYAFCFGLFALIAQFFYFETYSLTQNPKLRPWLLGLCETLGCDLPDYQNAGEISILQTALKKLDASSYRFKAVIVNQSDYSQPYPHIRLTLLDFTGEAMTERVFSPADYKTTDTMLASDDSSEIVVDIAVPNRKFGGYSFKLL